jgi:hypothetical protein
MEVCNAGKISVIIKRAVNLCNIGVRIFPQMIMLKIMLLLVAGTTPVAAAMCLATINPVDLD